MRRQGRFAAAAPLATLVVVALAALARPAAAQEPAPSDSLSHFLEQMTDSTDALFGSSVEFDTLGLDTLVENALTLPVRPFKPASIKAWYPVIGFHRSTGATAGLGRRTGTPQLGVLDLRGSYATSAELGRYAFAWRRTIWAPGPVVGPYRTMSPGRIGDRTRLDLDLRYARENLAYMPEHADPDNGAIGAFRWGPGDQSIYEARGGSAALTLWTGDWRLGAGVRKATDKDMPVATRFSLFGTDEDVSPNTHADADDYTEPYGGVAYWRPDQDFGWTIDGRGGGGDRWRLRGVAAKALRFGAHIKWAMQVEAGAAAARAPRQRRFEVGGARTVPTLPYGSGGTDHLLFGRGVLTASPDVLETLHLPHPRWLVLVPSVFIDGGSVWDDPSGRDVVFSTPPSRTWLGAAGGGLTWRIGIPEPDIEVTFWMAWPIGPNGGEPQFNISTGHAFALLGRL